MSERIGFMQGRLSPVVDGKIQAFPWSAWKEEFPLAQQNGFHLMEWTLDQEQLYENPLLHLAGQNEIKALSLKYNVRIPSLTGDCFMQAPFWKAEHEERKALTKDFQAVLQACLSVGIQMIVVPLVDNGRLQSLAEEEVLIDFLQKKSKFLIENKLKVIFECDFPPQQLLKLISQLDPKAFGINYDIGNSAALGFDPEEEIKTYGSRIMNVHVKDRKLHGTTVPLGTGNARFEIVFASLAKLGYTGNYILQTARAEDGDHVKTLSLYRAMTLDWLNRYGA